MKAVGQPYTRLGRTYGFCAKAKGHSRVKMRVLFNDAGKVVALRRGR